MAGNARQARAAAWESDWLCNHEYIDLRATRIPELDDLAEGRAKGILPFEDVDLQRRLRRLGWHEYDHWEDGDCTICGLFEFEAIDESQLDHRDDGSRVCGECRNKLETNGVEKCMSR